MSEPIEAIPATPATPAMPATPIDKPGIQTSEFWQTTAAVIVPSLVTLLVWINVVPDNLQKTLADSMLAMTNGLITIVAIWQYISSRKAIKIKSMEINFAYKQTRENFVIQLYNQGLVSPSFLHGEFGVPRSFALSPIVKTEK